MYTEDISVYSVMRVYRRQNTGIEGKEFNKNLWLYIHSHKWHM